MPYRTTPPPEARWTDRGDRGHLALAIVLIAIGALFLVQQMTGFDVWTWAWPLIVVALGGLLFAAAFFAGRGASATAIPASIVTMTGLILLVQNTFDLWQTWAYAWALIFPTAVGVGIWIDGWLAGRLERQDVGRRMAEIGVVVFLGFAAFFELLLNLSGFVRGGLGGIIVAVLLILVGFYLLVRQAGQPPGPAGTV